MSDSAIGGASSASSVRANPASQSSALQQKGSQSEPLQRLEAPRPQRKAPVHFPPIESGFRSVIVYVTICVRGKRPLLANDTAAQLIVAAWQAATFWCVGRYVIMPDHIHLFCAPNIFPAQSLKKWIGCWKNHVTRGWDKRWQIPVWQREFWDRQLRRVESYDEKWEYVKNNPVRHGFVFRAENWPY